MVDLIGIEPMTSSLPCCGSNRKRRQERYESAKNGLFGAIYCQNATKFNQAGQRADGVDSARSIVDFPTLDTSVVDLSPLRTLTAMWNAMLRC